MSGMFGTDDVWAELIIGERIRRLRKNAVMTQDDLAAAADVSTDLIRKLEQGRRQTASLASLSRIARALGVSLAALLGPAPSGSAGQDQGPILAIRDALTSVDDILGELDDLDVPDLTELDRTVTYAFGTYRAGRYATVAALLPRLLAEARAATHAATVAEAGRAADLAARVHQITAKTLVWFDAADLGHVAAREALRLAADALDPLRLASARATFSGVLLSGEGRYGDAERVYVTTAKQLEPTGQASTAHWSVYAALLVGGATAAARQRRSGVVTDLLVEAAAVAHQTGRDRTDYGVFFGPSWLVMQSTDCAVVTGDYVMAAEAARRMPRDSALPLASRSRHLVDVAHTQLRLGHFQAAESTLLTIEQATPEWAVRHRLPRILVGELLTRGRPSSRLRELAQRLHATPGRPED